MREPIVSTEGTSSETNSPLPVLDKVLVDTMATLMAILGTVPIMGATPRTALALIPAAGSDVPIVLQMGAVGDRTTNVAPLPTFSGWPVADLDQDLSKFFMACIANNGRMEDVWLRWLLAALKDTSFEWYNYRPTGSFPNWNALKEAFLLHFRPIAFENQLREKLMA